MLPKAEFLKFAELVDNDLNPWFLYTIREFIAEKDMGKNFFGSRLLRPFNFRWNADDQRSEITFLDMVVWSSDGSPHMKWANQQLINSDWPHEDIVKVRVLMDNCLDKNLSYIGCYVKAQVFRIVKDFSGIYNALLYTSLTKDLRGSVVELSNKIKEG